MTNHLDILGITICIDDQLYRNRTRIFLATRLIRKFWINGMDDLRRSNASTNAHNTATVASATTRSHAIAASRTDSATEALPEARTTAATLRSQRNLGRLRETNIRHIGVWKLHRLRD